MSAIAPVVDVRRSFLRLVCPFFFDSATMPTVVGGADAATWSPRGTSHPVWNQVDYRYLLPGVQRYINAPRPELSAAGCWRLDESFLGSPAGLGGSRLWSFRLVKHLHYAKLKAVELAVFGTGVGFVVFEFVLTNPPRGIAADDDFAAPGDPATWVDLAKLLRRLLYLSIIRKEIHASSLCSLHNEMATLLGTVGLKTSPVLDQAAGDGTAIVSAQPITYTSLFLTGASEDQMRAWTVQLRYNIGSRPLYEVAPEELSLRDSSIYRRSEGSWFYGSTVAAGFIATDLAPRGYWQQFPSELRREYQLALLLALQQRHALLSISDLVSDHWLNANEQLRVAQFSQLQERLHYLSARLMPPQLGYRSSPQRFYATMRTAFQIAELYDDVRQTVSELSESLRLRLSEEQGEQQHRFERMVSGFALLFGVPSLVLAFLAIDVTGIRKPLPMLIALAAVTAAFGLGGLVGLIARRRNA
jgi:hypothetical protein